MYSISEWVSFATVSKVYCRTRSTSGDGKTDGGKTADGCGEGNDKCWFVDVETFSFWESNCKTINQCTGVPTHIFGDNKSVLDIMEEG